MPIFLIFFNPFLLFEKHKIGKIANYATSHFGSSAASNACDPEIEQKVRTEIVAILGLNLSRITLVQMIHVIMTENFPNLHVCDEPRRWLTA